MRASGILLPVSSLPSKYGIGCFSEEAYEFVDQLARAGQKYWQILPLGPTGYGDSPYQPFSTFAGNPYFIDLDILCKENLLKKKECESFDWGTSEEYIDYGTMYVSRYALLHKAYARFVKNMPEDFSSFCEAEKDWLEDYTLFMALKDANDGKAWAEWDEKLRVRDAAALDEARKKYAEDIEFYKMLQYLFFKQWRELKAYANENGIEIIGDVPIYVAGDSADVWANPKQFYLDEDLNPIEEAIAYRKLLNDFNITQEELSKRIGKSRVAIANTIRLTNLDDRVQQYIIESIITEGHGRTLLAINDKQKQYELAQQVIDEKLSVRELERLIKKLTEEDEREKVIWSSDLNPYYKEITNQLQNYFGTKVNILNKKNKGKIEIEYYSEAELERIVEMIESIR